MIDDTLLGAEKGMEASIEALNKDLAGIRTSRASPALVEHIKVDYSGTSMPVSYTHLTLPTN